MEFTRGFGKPPDMKNWGEYEAVLYGLTMINPGKNGWGGRTRTFTIRINSAVSYRLDHAPVGVPIVLSDAKL